MPGTILEEKEFQTTHPTTTTVTSPYLKAGLPKKFTKTSELA